MTRDEIVAALRARVTNQLHSPYGGGLNAQIEMQVLDAAYRMLQEDHLEILRLKALYLEATVSDALLQFTARVQGSLMRWDSAKKDLDQAEQELAALYEVAAHARGER